MFGSFEPRPISRGIERQRLRRTPAVATGGRWGSAKNVQGNLFADGPDGDEGDSHVQMPSTIAVAPAAPSRASRQGDELGPGHFVSATSLADVLDSAAIVSDSSRSSRTRLFGNLGELAATSRLVVDRPVDSRHPRPPQAV